MPLTLDWQQIAIRLTWTVIAGMIIGFNRSEHGRPAGMRTTLLVCLAASLSMIQCNILLDTVGRAKDSFVSLDVMRLPLGILSGMGFIGGGAILRKDNLVLGVTTAATLWFTTMMGLCFGGGQIGLGIAALVLGLGTIWGLKYLENAMRRDVRATLVVGILTDGPSDEEIRAMIATNRCQVISWGVMHGNRGAWREVRAEIERRICSGETHPPDFVGQLAKNPQIEKIQWQPQGMSISNGVPPDLA